MNHKLLISKYYILNEEKKKLHTEIRSIHTGFNKGIDSNTIVINIDFNSADIIKMFCLVSYSCQVFEIVDCNDISLKFREMVSGSVRIKKNKNREPSTHRLR